MIEGEEIAARDILVKHDSLEVRAFDYTPVPYDREKLTDVPPPAYDKLTIYSTVDRTTFTAPLEQLPHLIYALTELQRRVQAARG